MYPGRGGQDASCDAILIRGDTSCLCLSHIPGRFASLGFQFPERVQTLTGLRIERWECSGLAGESEVEVCSPGKLIRKRA